MATEWCAEKGWSRTIFLKCVLWETQYLLDGTCRHKQTLRAISKGSALFVVLANTYQIPSQSPGISWYYSPPVADSGKSRPLAMFLLKLTAQLSFRSHLDPLKSVWCRRPLIYVGMLWCWHCAVLFSSLKKTEPEVASCSCNCLLGLIWQVPTHWVAPSTPALSWRLLTSWQ